MNTIRISGAGCCLLDYVYSGIDFSSPAFRKYLSEKPGDGGLRPGALVFTEEFEQFSGKPFHRIRRELTGTRDPDMVNLGGPGIVPLIHSAQMLGDQGKVSFFGALGNDGIGKRIRSIIRQTPIDTGRLKTVDAASPFTYVLSDPGHAGGHGERTFINHIGAAALLSPGDLLEDFFDADMVVFGGTALVPGLHDHLDQLLEKSKEKGAITLVNTVYDFRNEKKGTREKWPLGDHDSSMKMIDLLIMDHEESLKISGRKNLRDATDYFIGKQVSSFIITNGPEPVTIFSDGQLFSEMKPAELPVSTAIQTEIRRGEHSGGDTTGCGDNFAGGVIFSLAKQLTETKGKKPGLTGACSWGIVSGGFALSYMGGTYIEREPGRKRKAIEKYYELYRKQLRNSDE